MGLESKLKEIQPSKVYVCPKQHVRPYPELWANINSYNTETKRNETLTAWEVDKPLELRVDYFNFEESKLIARSESVMVTTMISDVLEVKEYYNYLNVNFRFNLKEIASTTTSERSKGGVKPEHVMTIVGSNNRACKTHPSEFSMEFIQSELYPIGFVSGKVRYTCTQKNEDSPFYNYEVTDGLNKIYPFICCKTGNLCWFIAGVEHWKFGAKEGTPWKRLVLN